MAGRLCRRRVPGERGAAAVEFALVVPLLLAILFGIISYGFMLSFRQGLSQAAAESARAAAVSATTTDAARTTAATSALDDALDLYGVSCNGTSLLKGGSAVGTCSVTLAACENDAAARCATVALDYAYADHPWVPAFPFVPLPDAMSYSAVARVN
ncbi:TadE/TadG family type IV pilus assembly protein [Nocardioides pyridinolyticus]